MVICMVCHLTWKMVAIISVQFCWLSTYSRCFLLLVFTLVAILGIYRIIIIYLYAYSKFNWTLRYLHCIDTSHFISIMRLKLTGISPWRVSNPCNEGICPSARSLNHSATIRPLCWTIRLVSVPHELNPPRFSGIFAYHSEKWPPWPIHSFFMVAPYLT